MSGGNLVPQQILHIPNYTYTIYISLKFLIYRKCCAWSPQPPPNYSLYKNVDIFLQSNTNMFLFDLEPNHKPILKCIVHET